MFSLFKKSDSLPSTDKVWKTRLAQLNGMTTETLKVIQQKEMAVVVFWFEDKKKSFLEFCEKQNVAQGSLEGATPGATPVVYWIDASTVANSLSAMTKLSTYAKKGKITFFFDGHYPLIPREENMLEKLKTLERANITLIFCHSLDGVFLQHFGGERMTALLDQLGLKDDECLEHALITTSVKRAREKLSKEVVTEMTAHSEADWFAKNKLPML